MNYKIENCLYKKLCLNSQRHKYLYHYTDIDSLNKIIQSKSLRLTKLSQVNDSYENRRIMNLHKDKIYVACFTHRQNESVFMWKEYANKNKGVILKFHNLNNYYTEIYGEGNHHLKKIQNIDWAHTNYDAVSDWGYLDITIADIEYTRDFNNYKYPDNQLTEFFNNTIIFGRSNTDFESNLGQGLVKGIEWDSEEETRIRVTLRPKGNENVLNGSTFDQPRPQFDYIYLKLSEDMLKDLRVIINPWATDEFKYKVGRIIAKGNLEYNQIIESSLKEKIK